MTNQPEKHPLAAIEPVARALCGRLAEQCQQIVIAGSVRRRKPLVGDIELVAIPRFYAELPRTLLEKLNGKSGYERNALNDRLDELLQQGHIGLHVDARGRQTWGDLHRKFTICTRRGRVVKIDLFQATPENFGNILLIRTGSAEFSHWCVTPRVKGGALPDGLRQAGGSLWDGPHRLSCPTEEAFFAHLGLPVIPPELRQEQRWHRWLAENSRGAQM